MNQCTKLIQKIKQKGYEQQLLLLQSWTSNNLMGSNIEKSNIAIAIFKKLESVLKKYF